MLEEAGVTSASYPMLKRRLPQYAQEEWRQRLSEACVRHAGLGPTSLVLYDVSTLYFETDRGDGFRERAGQHILTAEDPLPPDLRDALALIK